MSLLLVLLLSLVSATPLAEEDARCLERLSRAALAGYQMGESGATLPFSEATLLPVHSATLTPGAVSPQWRDVRGLPPLFLVGDDPRSRAWLVQQGPRLHNLRALGLVVNVDNLDGLASLRQLVPGLTLSPASADDLAQRLGIRHYPVLITATGFEQ